MVVAQKLIFKLFFGDGMQFYLSSIHSREHLFCVYVKGTFSYSKNVNKWQLVLAKHTKSYWIIFFINNQPKSCALGIEDYMIQKEPAGRILIFFFFLGLDLANLKKKKNRIALSMSFPHLPVSCSLSTSYLTLSALLTP